AGMDRPDAAPADDVKADRPAEQCRQRLDDVVQHAGLVRTARSSAGQHHGDAWRSPAHRLALCAGTGLEESMVLFGRPDAVLAERVPLVRRFMPFIMRRRNESLVWFEQDVAVDAALAFADAFSRAHDVRLTFFQMALRSIARVLDEFPRLNRYVVGRRLYQR